MPTATIDGLRINYTILGEGGPPVALITGGRRGYDEFTSLGEKIAAEGFRVFLHDRRNTGASDIRIDGREIEEVVWADDLRELLAQNDALPAFIGGASSGARTAILYTLRHPETVRGLLLLRVTGGAFAAGRLPEDYYGQFIRAAEEGGMAAVCATDAYRERIAANPDNRAVLEGMDAGDFIAALTSLRRKFEAGAHYPVMGVSPAELGSITAPTLIIPGNDQTHALASGLAAHEGIPGSELHRLPVSDQDVPLITFDEWAPHEAEITRVFTDFMRRVERGAA